jgi:hypothetical protein
VAEVRSVTKKDHYVMVFSGIHESPDISHLETLFLITLRAGDGRVFKWQKWPRPPLLHEKV